MFDLVPFVLKASSTMPAPPENRRVVLHHTADRFFLILVLLLSSLVAGCASVPFDYPKKPSAVTRASDQTILGRASLEWIEEHDDASGFIALVKGNDALGVRLKMIEAAEESIDAQYFLIKPDQAGKLFVGSLLRAADRGVRVRFLIDDIFTPSLDSELSLLNSHPNIEVRLFNPMSRQSFKYWSMLVDFRRANRRMHNKSFTVDGALVVFGGRNIAEEYFEIQPEVEFLDLDVLGIGKVAGEVADTFDLFWNSSHAVPVEAFSVPVDPAELDRWRAIMEDLVSGARESVYSKALNSRLLQDVVDDRIEPYVAQAQVITDSPDKLQQKVGAQEYQTVVNELAQRASEAQSELFIITPYYVPRKSGAAFLESLLARGIRVVIVTNSLASTNHLAVHSGYARYRKQLLRAGAEIYEIKVDTPSGNDAVGPQPDKLTLHTKAVVIDRHTLFIGSLNLDPRSIEINTEMGVFVDSARIAGDTAALVEAALSEAAYKVVLDGKEQLRWIYDHGAEHKVYHKEPQTSFWQRFKVGFFRILPIEGQL
jgi:putative cardiolipin synthase